ncbi:MAG: hypothetical protein AB7F99_03330 [Vicinamibacterales bacterium]
MTDIPSGTNVEVERLMRAIEDEVRRERRTRLLARGGPTAYHDPDVYALVERAVRRAIDRSDADRQLLILPELLGDERTWRPQTHLRFSSHRPGVGGLIVGIKRRVLLPVMRWLYEWANDNFRRQDRVNRVLFASIEELAIENAKLRAELDAHQDPSH